MSDPPRSTTSSQPRWRRALPFALAAGLVAVALARIDRAAFLAALGRVHAPAYLGFTAAFVLVLLAADSLATVLIYRGAALPIRYLDFFILRGASYLPSLLNHHVGQAFVTVALSRAYGASLARVAGATLLVYASWLGCLLALAAVAFPLHGSSPAWSALALAPGLGYLAVLRARPAALAGIRVLAPLFEAGVRGHLIALAARLPHLVALFLGTWLPFWFFGVEIPFEAAIVRVPLVMVAVTLPITPQGLGTRDVLAGALFAPFAPGDTPEARLAVVGACTASWAVAIALVDVALGLCLLRAAMPEAMAARLAARRRGGEHPARTPEPDGGAGR